MEKVQLNLVNGFEDVREYYHVVRDGDACWVESINGKIINGKIESNNYRRIGLYYTSGKMKYFLQHRIFMMCFVPNPNNLPVVNHIDENKQNNLLSNLEWETYEGNNRKARDSGTNNNSGERNGNSKLKDVEIPLIFEMRKTGKTLKEIGAHFGVHLSTISKLLHGI